MTEDRSQQLCLIVGQAAMPDVVGQVEQVLEVIVERFDGLAASGVQALAGLAFQELQTLGE